MRKKLLWMLLAVGILNLPVTVSAGELWETKNGAEQVSGELEELINDSEEGEMIQTSEDNAVQLGDTDELQQAEGDVVVNPINFPDDNFRTFVNRYAVTDKNGQRIITSEQIKKITSIDCEEKEIKDLRGIEFFVQLEKLECRRNQLISLDVSGNSALKTLICNENQLTSLNISNNPALTYLECYQNQLTSLDASGCPSLTHLYCYENQLTRLNVSGDLSLVNLSCRNNQLTSLDVSNNPSLKELRCYENQLSDLNASGCSSLERLECKKNQLVRLNVRGCSSLNYLNCDENELTELDVRECSSINILSCEKNELTELDVSGNPSLEKLDCSGNQLGALNVDKNSELETLLCGDNPLPNLDVSKNLLLKILNCYRNQLTGLDVSNNSYLEELKCFGNQISALDIRGKSYLKTLWCDDNQLGVLKMEGNTALETLWCQDNQLADLELDDCLSLKQLWCQRNQLKSLDVSKCASLEHLVCENNQLACLDLSNNSSMSHGLSSGASAIIDGEKENFVSVISVDSNQIDMSKYDSSFDPRKVSRLRYLGLEGTSFTLLGDSTGKLIGTYTYDVGKTWEDGRPQFMSVALVSTGMKPTDPIPSPTSSPKPSEDWPFDDVPEKPGNWKYDNIKFVNEKGIMTGVTLTEFQPDAQLTRAQFASVIYRMAGSPQVTYQNIFTDVAEGKWYSNAIIWAYENRIVAGLGQGRYGINDNITREQMARMLMEFAKVQGYDTSVREDFGKFADASQVSGWALENMRWAVGSGIISGSTKDGKYYMNPKGQATRAECAVMLTKFIGKY